MRTRYSRVLVLFLACLFGVLVTFASTAQSMGKDGRAAVAAVVDADIAQDLADDGEDGSDALAGACAIDDQCLDDIMVETMEWSVWHDRAPSVAIGPVPDVHEHVVGLICPPPNA
ncbi:hypothetical protein KK141_04165 [Dyella sp. LX-66]|jgi:hypothetical protein|uniref:hypothetical protein n=1 Tax=unclassified Dyella TaxID=2634549 RepID=UPI001BE069C5|nr:MULTISPECIES: hypothetical protein [unclassified Dyella]MBT2118242.1 hypothetical protein [Dyella sp. LX-1]MBT2138732.1 hypothetical protein [Dyella sp. LX-66]